MATAIGNSHSNDDTGTCREVSMSDLLQEEQKEPSHHRLSSSSQQHPPADATAAASLDDSVTDLGNSVPHAGTTRGSATTNTKPLCSFSACDRVAYSWSVVSSDLEGAGIDFLTRVFLAAPEALNLFPFATENLSHDELETLMQDTDQLRSFIRESRVVKAHARLVMREVGRTVSGLPNVATLVPRLRSLGRMHSAAGVLPVHYDVFFGCLLETVRDRLGLDWDVPTAEAWQSVHVAIGRVMKNPSQSPVEVEMMGRWGAVMAILSIYLCFATPLVLAGLLVSRYVHLADGLVVTALLVEILGTSFLRSIKVADVRESKMIRRKRASLREGLKARLILGLRKLGLHEAVTYLVLDIIVLASYSRSILKWLQYVLPLQLLPSNQCESLLLSGDVSQNKALGALGFLRLVFLIRVYHAVRSVEISWIVRQRADARLQMITKILKLAIVLSYTTHLVGCLWFFVARLEISSEEDGPIQPTDFFPNPTILFGRQKGGLLNSYIRGLHFAWVNLAGIGSNGSEPSSTLECIFSLCVNVTGATLYAVTTGQIVAIIEPGASMENRISDDATSLNDFLTDIGATAEFQERIMQGFLLNSLTLDDGDSTTGPYAAKPGLNASAPEFPSDTVTGLPLHLREELRVLAISDALRRRDRIFRRCSDDFVNALASALRSTTTLLSGDYFLKEGDIMPLQPYVIEEGTMDVIQDGRLIRVLERGDMLGFHWIENVGTIKEGEIKEEKANRPFQIKRSTSVRVAFSPLLFSGDVAAATLRCTSTCKLATGLSKSFDVNRLKSQYPTDFLEISEVLDSAKEAKSKLISAAAAVLVARTK